MPALYEIGRQYNGLLDVIGDDEVTPEELMAALDAVDEAFDQKSLALARVIRGLQADEDAVSDEIRRLTAKRSALENKGGWLRQYLLINMTALGKERIKDSIITVSVKGKPPSVRVMDEAAVPQEYKTTTTHINLNTIRRDIKEGKQIPGVKWASDGVSISIR